MTNDVHHHQVHIFSPSAYVIIKCICYHQVHISWPMTYIYIYIIIYIMIEDWIQLFYPHGPSATSQVTLIDGGVVEPLVRQLKDAFLFLVDLGWVLQRYHVCNFFVDIYIYIYIDLYCLIISGMYIYIYLYSYTL